MYQILNNPEALVTDLSAVCVFYEGKADDFAQKAEDSRSRLLLLHRRSIAGENVSKALKEAKSEFEEFSLQLEACADAVEQLHDRLGKRILHEARERLAKIEIELSALIDERKPIYEEFLRTMARAGALHELLEGREIHESPMGKQYEYLPEPCLSISKLISPDEYIFYEKAVQAARAELNPSDTSIQGREGTLFAERRHLERFVESYDAEGAVKGAIEEARSRIQQEGVQSAFSPWPRGAQAAVNAADKGAVSSAGCP